MTTPHPPAQRALATAQAAFLRMVACGDDGRLWALDYLERLGPPGIQLSDDLRPIDPDEALKLLPEVYRDAFVQRRAANAEAADQAHAAWERTMADPDLPADFLRDAFRWVVEGREAAVFLAAALMGLPNQDRRSLGRLFDGVPFGESYTFSFLYPTTEAAARVMVAYGPRLLAAAERNPSLATLPDVWTSGNDSDLMLAWLGARFRGSLPRLARYALRDLGRLLPRTKGQVRRPRTIGYADDRTWVGAVLRHAVEQRPAELKAVMEGSRQQAYMAQLALWVLRGARLAPETERDALALAAVRLLYDDDMVDFDSADCAKEQPGGLYDLLRDEDQAVGQQVRRAVGLWLDDPEVRERHLPRLLVDGLAKPSGPLWSYLLEDVLVRHAPSVVAGCWAQVVEGLMAEFPMPKRLRLLPRHRLSQALVEIAGIMAMDAGRSLRIAHPQHARMLHEAAAARATDDLDATQRMYLQVLMLWTEPSEEAVTSALPVQEEAKGEQEPAAAMPPVFAESPPISGPPTTTEPPASTESPATPDRAPTAGDHPSPFGEEATLHYREVLDLGPQAAARALAYADLFGLGLDDLLSYLPRKRLPSDPDPQRKVVLEQIEVNRRARAESEERRAQALREAKEVRVWRAWTDAVVRSSAPEWAMNRLTALAPEDIRFALEYPNATVRTLSILLRNVGSQARPLSLQHLEPFEHCRPLRPQPWHEEVEDPVEQYLLYLGYGRRPDLSALTRGRLCHTFDPTSLEATLLSHALHHHRDLYQAAFAGADRPGRVGLAVGGLMSALEVMPEDPHMHLGDRDGLLRQSLLTLLEPVDGGGGSSQGEEAEIRHAELWGGLFEWFSVGRPPHTVAGWTALNKLLDDDDLLRRYGVPQLEAFFLLPAIGYLAPLLPRVLRHTQPQAMRPTWLAALERGAHRATLMFRQPDGAQRFQQEDRWAFRAMVWLRGAYPAHATYLLGLLGEVPATTEAVTRFHDELRAADRR